jgi:hypothetical protein
LRRLEAKRPPGQKNPNESYAAMVGSFNNNFSFIPFDFNLLTPIYTTGAKLGSAAHAQILANGPLKDILA